MPWTSKKFGEPLQWIQARDCNASRPANPNAAASRGAHLSDGKPTVSLKLKTCLAFARKAKAFPHTSPSL